MPRAPYGRAVFVALLGGLAAVSVAFGQRGEFYRRPTPTSFDGAFNFCRIAYRAMGMDGGGWNVDYPRADENLSIRLAELTKVSISREPWGQPNHLLLTLMDPELYRCPFAMLTEAGAAWFDEQEAAALRAYVRKGGFLWADDFWGERAWASWEHEIRKALPSGEFPLHEMPMDHTLFRMVFQVKEVPQIPSINYWRGSGGGTSERYDSQVPRAHAITDDRGRILVLMTHNTDIGDSWEQEAQDPEYFERFSVYGYAFGINAVVYAMTK